MEFTRRNFLGAATGAAAWVPPRAPARDCVLLDLGANCSLPESLAGYSGALPSARVSRELCECRSLIVPAAANLDDRIAGRLSTLVKAGACLLLESGLGFAGEFEAQRRLLRTHFDLTIEPAVDLRANRPRYVPYVDYRWPLRAKVRDFSRVIPVSAPESEIVGAAGTWPIALKRKLGQGTLVFLGSPLGPGLWTGEREARHWLKCVLSELDG